jgi:predicted DNA-binding transcriptional regulator YafY
MTFIFVLSVGISSRCYTIEHTHGCGQFRSATGPLLCNNLDVDTPARLLRLLALMSSRATWQSAELAERLEITERSVRRDMTRLRDLGYPIESVTGPYGGYSLGAGGRLPPLLLSDDEAVSIAVALHQIARRSAAVLADGAVSALTKLTQVMPAPLRERVSALSSVVVGVEANTGPDGALGGSGVEALMALALACSRNERTRFDYRTGDGVESMRHTEPYRLVAVGQRWYLVAYDVDRADWRTFRVDRISRVRSTGARFQRGEVPDAAAFVAEGLAISSYEHRAIIRVHATPEETAREVHPTIGVVRDDPEGPETALIEIGGDLDWLARFVVSLPFRYEIVEPDALRDELRRFGRELIEHNKRRAPARSEG